uniref:Uncharacterized protein n=1 Tax=Meloidogyne javanica TaxID=6303 RepID=A0A915N7S4_MELJA
SVHHLSGRVQALELNRDEANQPPVVRPAGNVQGENGGGVNLDNGPEKFKIKKMPDRAHTIEDVYNFLTEFRNEVRVNFDTLKRSVRNLEFGTDLETLRHSVHHLSERVQSLELNRDAENPAPIVRPAGNIEGEDGVGVNLDNG